MTYRQKRKRKSPRHQLFLPRKPRRIKDDLGVPGFTGEQLVKMDPCRYCANMQGYGREGSMRCFSGCSGTPEGKLETCFAPMKGITVEE